MSHVLSATGSVNTFPNTSVRLSSRTKAAGTAFAGPSSTTDALGSCTHLHQPSVAPVGAGELVSAVVVPMRRTVDVGRQERACVASGGVELGLCQVEGFGKIGPFKTGVSEVSPKKVSTGQITVTQVRSDEIGASKIHPTQRPGPQPLTHEVRPGSKCSIKVIITGGEIRGSHFLADIHQ